MKTLLKKILVLAVMLGTYTSYANEALNIETIFNHDIKKGSFISVSDDSGEVIYSATVKYNGNLKTLFDFSKLKNGKYTVEINKDFEIEINTIEVINNTVTYAYDNPLKIYKPVFRIENDKLLISKLAIDETEMEVQLYYENELIYKEIIKGKEILNRVYKLDRNIKGDYTAIIESNDRVFVESFRI